MKVIVSYFVLTLVAIISANSQEMPRLVESSQQPLALAMDTQSLQQNIETLMCNRPVELSDEEFKKRVIDYIENPNEWVYLGDKPAIIDFYASWSEASNILSPIIDEIAREYGDQVYIYKINADKELAVTRALDIRTLPTILFIPQNSTPQVSLGAMMKSDLVGAIESVLLSDD